MARLLILAPVPDRATVVDASRSYHTSFILLRERDFNAHTAWSAATAKVQLC
jgi:hypothetical protein